MAKVFYTKINRNSDYSNIAKKLFETVLEDSNIKLTGDVPIKVHFGEKGNQTFIPANYYDGIIDVLEEGSNNPAFIETNVLYRGSRTIKSNHLEVAKDHGFTRIPIIIADGEIGEDYVEVEINKEFYKKCMIGKEYLNYDQTIVCSHFKGHGLAAFGGAIKQLAMGFAARGGKMAQHASLLPKVTQDDCVACGICVNKCDFDAITIDKKAFINDEKCVGCAGCIAVCPTKAINNDWTGQNFKLKLAEYAYGAQFNKEHIYIQYGMNITEECDCHGRKMDLISDDIGIFASTDPIAIDTACLDLYVQLNGKTSFEAGRETLEYGEKIGLGSRDYNLIEVN